MDFFEGFMDELLKVAQVPFKATAAGRMQASRKAMGGLQKQLSSPGGLFGSKQQASKGALAGTATKPQQTREADLGRFGQFNKGQGPASAGPQIPSAPQAKPVTPTSPATPSPPGAAKVTGGGIKPGFAAKYSPFGKQTAKSLGIPGASPF